MIETSIAAADRRMAELGAELRILLAGAEKRGADAAYDEFKDSDTDVVCPYQSIEGRVAWRDAYMAQTEVFHREM